MALLSAKHQAQQVLSLLRDITPDNESAQQRFMTAAEDYIMDLLEDMSAKFQNHISDERMTAIVREYCQRFDGVVHRVEQGMLTSKPTFPLFRGALFAAFIHRLKTSPNRSAMMPIIEKIARGLPYGVNDVAVTAMITDIRFRVADDDQKWDERLITSMDEIMKDIATEKQLLALIPKALEIVESAKNRTYVLANLHLQVMKCRRRLQ